MANPPSSPSSGRTEYTVRWRHCSSVSAPKDAPISRIHASAATRSGNSGALPTYCAMRCSETEVMTGPTSLSTSRVIGVCGWLASTMPMIPPIDVPTQCTSFTFRRAIRVTMSFTYTGKP